MNKLEKVKNTFKKYGYDLIGDYIHIDVPCKCKCNKCGNVVNLVLHHIDERRPCKNCDHLSIIAYFDENNCKIIGKPSLSKTIKYICSCGTKSTTKWFNFKHGERCKLCGIKKMKANNTKGLKVKNNIHKYFENMGCKLLGEYINQKTSMKYICSCGRESTITWKCFQQGCRCKDCAKEKIKNKFVPYGKYHYNWNPNREEVELNKKIRNKAKKSLKRILKITNKAKLEKTFEMLGYSKKDLINHIKNHPNWISVKNKDWELDHRFPVKAFIDHGIYEERIINMLDNLQPLSKMENRVKNDKYDLEKFEKWLSTKVLFGLALYNQNSIRKHLS
jgi:hypothetical protein